MNDASFSRRDSVGSLVDWSMITSKNPVFHIRLRGCRLVGLREKPRKIPDQVAEIANGVYGADTVTANYVQCWFRPLRSGIFNVKDVPRTDKPIVDNVDKITEIIEIDRHVSSRKIAQELKIDHKTVLSHLRKVEFKKKTDMVTGDENWVTYYNIVRKRSWSKCGEAAQTVAKPGLLARKVLLCIWWNWKGII
ncbi:putative DD34D transposase [Trichonephila clavipes]|nr:putative DD34D transposase [Trichonephila clavipes]